MTNKYGLNEIKLVEIKVSIHYEKIFNLEILTLNL